MAGWAQSTCLAGVGVEDNRWLAPVRPGDRLSAETKRWKNSICALVPTPESSNSPHRCAIRTANKCHGAEALDPVRAPRARWSNLLRSPAPSKPAKPAEIATYRRSRRRHAGRFRAGRGSAPMPIWARPIFHGRFHQDPTRKNTIPLPFHTDEEAGKAHLLGAMSAAGWQTASCWMRHFIALRRKVAGGGDPPASPRPVLPISLAQAGAARRPHRLFDPGGRQARRPRNRASAWSRAAISASTSAARSRSISSPRCFRASGQTA